MTLLFIIFCSMVVLALTVTAFLSRHKKTRLQHLQLIGSTGVVESNLNPEGTVLVDGEVWRACASDKSVVEVGTRIEVVGSRQHLLIVEKW